jgi:hypothetical protein
MPAKRLRDELAEWLTLDDWRMFRDALGLVERCNSSVPGPKDEKQDPIRTWAELGSRVERNGSAMRRRFDQISEKLRSLSPDNRGALIDKKTWLLTDLGQRMRLAAAALLDRGLAASLDILCNENRAEDRPPVISASEAVKTYLLPNVPLAGLVYELLPWTPYMTTRAAAELLLSRRADLVITWADRGDIPRMLEAQEFGPNRGVRLIVHQTHPVAQRRLNQPEEKASAPVTVPELAGEVFAAPLDTHLASTAHNLIDASNGNIRVSNVGRFPQALTHVQLTRAFSIFPDWPWCLRPLRKTSGLLSFPITGIPAQTLTLRAIWRAGESSPSPLLTLRRAVANAYSQLCDAPRWKLSPLVQKVGTVRDGATFSLCYFHAPFASEVAPTAGWVTAQIVWEHRGSEERTGRWLVSEDRPDAVLVRCHATERGVLVQMTGSDGFPFVGAGLLSYTARKSDGRQPKWSPLVGTLSFRTTSGQVASSPCILALEQLQHQDVSGIQTELNEQTLLG